MARILRANLNQPRRDSGIPHESASGAFGIRTLKLQAPSAVSKKLENANMDELSYQIRRVAPSVGWYGAVWQTPSVSNKGVPFWESACFSDITAFIEALRRYPSALSVKNLYFTPATFKASDCSRRRNPPQLDRHARNFLATRTLAIDGDVKPSAFATTAECKETVLAMLTEIGLKPSFIVLTSAPLDPAQPATTSGMHFYLTMTSPPSSEDRKAMADDLVAALKHRGLVFDTGVTSDAVRVLRSVGSLNRKTDEARIARLDLESLDGPDYDPDELKAILARARPPGCAHNSPPSDHAHVDLAEVASAADHLLGHGHYGPGLYFHLRDLFFGLAQLGCERPYLHDGARSLFERIAVATGTNMTDNIIRDIHNTAPKYRRRPQAAIDAFAAINGWRTCGQDSYDLRLVGRVADCWHGGSDGGLLDHCIWYRKNGRYVAVIGQPYLDRDFAEVRDDLAKRDLVLHLPPDPLASFHYPGWTMFFVITRPAVGVRFLPEQDGRLKGLWRKGAEGTSDSFRAAMESVMRQGEEARRP
jgi:hypothetical protein